MQTLTACPACGSQSLLSYACTVPAQRANTMHFAQSRCRNCDVVFSNPVVEQFELERFYGDQYYEHKEHRYNANSPDLEKLVLQRAGQEVEGLKSIVVPYVSSGRFFEIGAGHGSLLYAARRLGFEVAGVEPSASAVKFGQECLGLSELRKGVFKPSDWRAESFDVVYAYHVIEHVLDLQTFVAGIHRVLKPGGIAVIGTENHHNTWVQYRTIRSWLKGRLLPEFQTADHHTFYFCNHSLGRLLQQHGLEIKKCLVYTHSLEEKLRNAHFRSILTKGFFYLLHYGDAWTGRGNRLLLWCSKRAVESSLTVKGRTRVA